MSFKHRLFLPTVLSMMLLKTGWLGDFSVISGKKETEGNEPAGMKTLIPNTLIFYW